MGIIDKLEKKLEGGKFRLLNEKMYKNKELTQKEAREYHKFYLSQINKWPTDPKKIIIKKIEENGQKDMKIADLGCGSCGISEAFKNVQSFDKYPVNEKVIKCELEKIPTEDKNFEVAICCLSLMMTNISKILKEVNRILNINGVFYISEVTSRVINMKTFINGIEKYGFKIKKIDKSNTHFFVLEFEKISEFIDEGKLPRVMLKEWVYKKR